MHDSSPAKLALPFSLVRYLLLFAVTRNADQMPV
jgi:hypothetical protein